MRTAELRKLCLEDGANQPNKLLNTEILLTDPPELPRPGDGGMNLPVETEK